MNKRPFTMRDPCKHGCLDDQREAWKDAYIIEVNGQDVVRCSRCDRAQYNAPRIETGRAPRTLTTVHNGVKPGQRVRVLLRDGRCIFCGTKDNLQVGHIISVKDGLKEGFTDQQINHDGNLAAMCAECNAGLSSRTIPLWIAAPILRAYFRQFGSDTNDDE